MTSSFRAIVGALISSVFLLLLPVNATLAFQDNNNESEETQGLEAWNKIYEIVSHPRCANCHVADGVPIWSGPSFGKTRPHGMNVGGNPDNLLGEPGQYCTTCHMAKNSTVRHGPPGAPVWHLPPKEMVWYNKSSAHICAQLKDPSRNGERTLAQIKTHVAQDELVGWGWAPGPGREPAPYSATEMASFVQIWADSNAPCPPLEASDNLSGQLASLDTPQQGAGTQPILGDIQDGKRAAAVCKSCHSFVKDGPNLVGPNLWGVYERDVASVKNANYSASLKAISGKWDEKTLDEYLKAPTKLAPGTSMVISIKQDKKRADIITYLKTLK